MTWWQRGTTSQSMQTSQAASNAARLPGRSAIWGLISLVVTPIAAMIAILTIVGIPLGVAVTFAYIVSLMVAMIVAAVALGSMILKGQSIWIHLLIGLLIIYILGSIPILGGLVRLVVLVIGLGALILTFRRASARGTISHTSTQANPSP